MNISINKIHNAIGKRIDLLLLPEINEIIIKQLNIPDFILTRSQLAKALPYIISINGKAIKPSYKLRFEDKISIDPIALQDWIKDVVEIDFNNIPAQSGEINIVDETSDYIIINKAKGVVMHPAPGNVDGTLAAKVKAYLMNKGEYDPKVERAGIVHRLDKGVSGLVIFAKNRQFQLEIKRQFESHNVIKIYHAQIDQEPSHKLLKLGKVINLEGFTDRKECNRKLTVFTMNTDRMPTGRYAISTLKYLGNKELLIRIYTGRKHQIRATLKYLGLSISGDKNYGSTSLYKEGIALEAIFLSFIYKGEKVVYNLRKELDMAEL